MKSRSQCERVFIIRVPCESGGIWRRGRVEVKEIAVARAFDRRKVVSNIPAAFDVVAQWLHNPSRTDA